MKQLAMKILLLIPIVIAMVIINLIVDPAHLFDSNSYAEKMVYIMQSGNSVAGASNYDDRILQKKYVESIQKSIDTIVIGSSRCMQISTANYSKGSFFNNSVSDAILKDDIAIVQLYRENGLMPKQVIICADPWLFNANYTQSRWKVLHTFYQKGISWLGINDKVVSNIDLESIQIEKYLELISPAYLQNSLHFLEKYNKPDDLIYPDPALDSKDIMKRSDGSISYDESFRNLDTQTVRNLVMSNMRDSETSLEGFSQLDSQLQKEFELLVVKLKKEGVKVTIFLSPYHPLYYSYLTSTDKYKTVMQVQNYLQDFATKQSIQIIGSYNPNDIPCSEDEFYDQKHPKPVCILKIIANQ